MSSNAPVTVLLGPVLEGLDIKASGCYVDGTFGRGGHSRAILERLTANGRLIAIDRDPQAIASAPEILRSDPRFELIRGESAQLEKLIDERGLRGNVDGVLLDLGVSSPQLDEAGRGFSFLRDGPLDMRMDPDTGISAAEWLERVDERELKRVLKSYGEERHAARIARAIVTDPTLLLCDEPTGALDVKTGIIVLESIAQINRELGTTTAVITHNAAIAKMADRVISLSDGWISGVEVNHARISAAELSW